MDKHAWDETRSAVLATAQEMARRGLVVGSSGNVSARLEGADAGLLAITPTGQVYSALQPRDIVVCDLQGRVAAGDLPPSTELPLHAAIYRAQPGVVAVVHTHSLYATAVAVAGLDIPAIVDEMVVQVGGAVRVAEYAPPGTAELGERALAALGERMAVLLRNHGLLAVGRTLEGALAVAELVERMAHVFVMARLMGGAQPLPAAVVEEEISAYRRRLLM